MAESGRNSTTWKITWFKILSHPYPHIEYQNLIDGWRVEYECCWTGLLNSSILAMDGSSLFSLFDFAGMYCEPSTHEACSRVCKEQSFSSKRAASSMERALVKSPNAFSAHCIVLRHISTTLAIRTNKHKQTESEWREHGSQKPKKMRILSQAFPSQLPGPVFRSLPKPSVFSIYCSSPILHCTFHYTSKWCKRGPKNTWQHYLQKWVLKSGNGFSAVWWTWKSAGNDTSRKNISAESAFIQPTSAIIL